MKAKKIIICVFASILLVSCTKHGKSSVPAQTANTEPQFLFDEDFKIYNFISKKEIDGTMYTLLVVVSGGFGEKVEFVQVYEGDLESVLKNKEKVAYYEPLIYEDILLLAIQADENGRTSVFLLTTRASSWILPMAHSSLSNFDRTARTPFQLLP